MDVPDPRTASEQTNTHIEGCTFSITSLCTIRINPIDGIIAYILVQIDIPSGKPYWVFGEKPPMGKPAPILLFQKLVYSYILFPAAGSIPL